MGETTMSVPGFPEAPPAGASRRSGWRWLLFAAGWVTTFAVTFNTTDTALRLVFEAAGIDTVAEGPSSLAGDERNPPGQYAALLAALAVAATVTVLLYIWYQARPLGRLERQPQFELRPPPHPPASSSESESVA